MQKQSLFHPLPERGAAEHFSELMHTPNVRIERIVSHGQSSPAEFWYDQDEGEWVMLLQGYAVLAFADGSEVELKAGDYLHLPAHCRHRVAMTAADQPTVWLAVFYRPS